MKLTVIGCWGGYPAPGEATSAYLLEKDDYSLLIDAGSGSLSKLQQYKNVMDIDAIILSHYHQDHIADIGVFQYAWLTHAHLTGNDYVLPVYGHTEDKSSFAKLTHHYSEGNPYNPNETLKIGPFSITFIKTKHSVPCYGMRITDGDSVLVYTADTSYQNEWISFCKDADLLITDCNFYAKQDGSVAGHMTSAEGAEIAKASSVQALLLSHLPQYGNLNQLKKEASDYYHGDIYLAKGGFVWEF